MAAGANSPGTLNSFFQFIFRIWNLDFAAGDYSPGTFRLITLPAFAFRLFFYYIMCDKFKYCDQIFGFFKNS